MSNPTKLYTRADMLKDAWAMLEWIPKQLKTFSSNACGAGLSAQLWNHLDVLKKDIQGLQEREYTIGDFFKGQENEGGPFYIFRFDGFCTRKSLCEFEIAAACRLLISTQPQIQYSELKDEFFTNMWLMQRVTPIKITLVDLPQYADALFKGTLYEEMLNA